MRGISYTAHVSNKKSAITSKAKLESVAKHNLRKYKSSDYSAENIQLLYGTDNLVKDVKEIYHREFDEALQEYNQKQKRTDRKIKDYFEHVAGKEQDLAVEIIIQLGDRDFWQVNEESRYLMRGVYKMIVDELATLLPAFKIANAVVHFDEDSPHMHIVGVPVAEGFKKSLRKQVSKRSVFTPETLSKILQDDLREYAARQMGYSFNGQIKEKSKGRNYDLSVTEYKVTQEAAKLVVLRQQVNGRKGELEAINTNIGMSNTLLKVLEDERKEKIDEVKIVVAITDKIKRFIGEFRLFAPTIEEYANTVENGGKIEAGNKYRGILYEIGELLAKFKERIKEGVCWFPRLMRWQTSVGEVAPMFHDTDDGYSYSICGYMDVENRTQYSMEYLQAEIIPEKRVGTVEQMDANMIALEKDIAEILRLSGEQERLWKEYR